MFHIGFPGLSTQYDEPKNVWSACVLNVLEWADDYCLDGRRLIWHHGKAPDKREEASNLNELGIVFIKHRFAHWRYATYKELMEQIMRSGILPSGVKKVAFIMFDEDEIKIDDDGDAVLTFRWIRDDYEMKAYEDAADVRISLNELVADGYRVLYFESPLVDSAELPYEAIRYSLSSSAPGGYIDRIDSITIDRQAPADDIFQNNRMFIDGIKRIVARNHGEIKETMKQFGWNSVKDIVIGSERLSYGGIAFDAAFKAKLDELMKNCGERPWASVTDTFLRYTRTSEDPDLINSALDSICNGFDVLRIWQRVFDGLAIMPNWLDADNDDAYYNGLTRLGIQIGMPKRIDAYMEGVPVEDII